MKLGKVAKVRLAKPPRAIAEFLEPVTNRSFVQRKPKIHRSGLSGPGIEFVAEALLVTARHESRASGTAVWTGNIATGETNAAFGQCINVRSWDLRIALATELAVAEIVGDDDEDIGFAFGGLNSERCGEEGQDNATYS